jgi:predicted DNA-binding transcriptional regulator AlpA
MRRAEETKVAVTVAEMARKVGLSRARFYQLIQAGVFPAPERHSETSRPYYGEELQRTCLEVRRRNCGVNGQPVLFYARRLPTSTAATRPRKIKAAAKADPHAGLVDAVKALGLKAVTPAQVAAAVAQVYPKGSEGVEENEVIVAVFNHLMSRTKS